ncbi:MAG: nucleotidyltransferase [Anaerolineae bacterium]|nr:MAG: nucleotidyltransferase [Anaerolineae bacterium]WKZ43493.1 MAG: nucleotidyltransferase family protein [Anaerolineales bacterium]HNS45581.1 nucleotidyltransferase family protein [Alphaproteobacteria bacterium]
MDKIKIRVPREQLREFCRKNHIKKLAFFGSVLRDDFGPHSDVDVLIEFETGKTPGFAFYDLQEELKELFDRDVDLHTFKGVETSRNPYRRKAILESAQVYYVA